MNNKKSRSDKDANMIAMKVLSDIRSSNDAIKLVTGAQLSVEDKVASAAIDRAIAAIYMQNKLIDTIESIQSKPCFVTDSNGVVAILNGLKIGSEQESE